MESLKIRDKKTVVVEEEAEIEVDAKVEQKEVQTDINAENQVAPQIEEEFKAPVQTSRSSKPTFGQSLMEKVKKFFEEVE
ncbi:hypothetical protein D3C87_1898920 [compost metagenome]